jgi:hypothetical protein
LACWLAAYLAFDTDKAELKPGLVLFRRGDVEHRMWYCRMKIPKADRYKTVSLKTTDIEVARERAFDQDARASKETGMERGEYTRVKSVDADKNQLTVVRADGSELTYDPRRQHGVSVLIRSGPNDGRVAHNQPVIPGQVEETRMLFEL